MNLLSIKKFFFVKTPESKLAHQYLDGLRGLEIGGSAHNPFGLNTKNVDISSEMDTVFKLEEKRVCGSALPVDIIAPGDEIPIPDNSQDFIVSSHVLEHFYDPIKALKEWYRIVRPDGYIFMIVPHKERTFERGCVRTTLQELIERHKESYVPDVNKHFSIWVTEDVVELIEYLGWNIVEACDVDDKSGTGFTVVVQKAVVRTQKKVKIQKQTFTQRNFNKFVIIAKKVLSARIVF